MQALDSASRARIRCCQPGSGFLPFRVEGYDNGDGNPTHAEGDHVDEANVTWQLIHRYNVASMIKHGILDPNTARVKLKNLKQGNLNVDVFVDAFENHFSVAHPTADIMNFLPDLIDGFASSIVSPFREATPHVTPFQTRILDMEATGTFKGKSFPEVRAMFDMEQAKMRRDLRISFDTPYAPYDPAQPRQLPGNPQHNTLQIAAINSTVVTPTLEDAMQSFLTGQGKITEALERRLSAVETRADQTAVELKTTNSTLQALVQLSADTQKSVNVLADSTHQLVSRVDTLVTKSADTSPSAPDSGARPFKGKCFNCQKIGHRAGNCPQRIKQSTINAVTDGVMNEHVFNEQFGDQIQYVACLTAALTSGPNPGAVNAVPQPNVSQDREIAGTPEDCIKEELSREQSSCNGVVATPGVRTCSHTSEYQVPIISPKVSASSPYPQLHTTPSDVDIDSNARWNKNKTANSAMNFTEMEKAQEYEINTNRRATLPSKVEQPTTAARLQPTYMPAPTMPSPIVADMKSTAVKATPHDSYAIERVKNMPWICFIIQRDKTGNFQFLLDHHATNDAKRLWDTHSGTCSKSSGLHGIRNDLPPPLNVYDLGTLKLLRNPGNNPTHLEFALFLSAEEVDPVMQDSIDKCRRWFTLPQLQALDHLASKWDHDTVERKFQLQRHLLKRITRCSELLHDCTPPDQSEASGMHTKRSVPTVIQQIAAMTAITTSGKAKTTAATVSRTDSTDTREVQSHWLILPRHQGHTGFIPMVVQEKDHPDHFLLRSKGVLWVRGAKEVELHHRINAWDNQAVMNITDLIVNHVGIDYRLVLLGSTENERPEQFSIKLASSLVNGISSWVHWDTRIQQHKFKGHTPVKTEDLATCWISDKSLPHSSLAKWLLSTEVVNKLLDGSVQIIRKRCLKDGHLIPIMSQITDAKRIVTPLTLRAQALSTTTKTITNSETFGTDEQDSHNDGRFPQIQKHNPALISLPKVLVLSDVGTDCKTSLVSAATTPTKPVPESMVSINERGLVSSGERLNSSRVQEFKSEYPNTTIINTAAAAPSTASAIAKHQATPAAAATEPAAVIPTTSATRTIAAASVLPAATVTLVVSTTTASLSCLSYFCDHCMERLDKNIVITRTVGHLCHDCRHARSRIAAQSLHWHLINAESQLHPADGKEDTVEMMENTTLPDISCHTAGRDDINLVVTTIPKTAPLPCDFTTSISAEKDKWVRLNTALKCTLPRQVHISTTQRIVALWKLVDIHFSRIATTLNDAETDGSAWVQPTATRWFNVQRPKKEKLSAVGQNAHRLAHKVASVAIFSCICLHLPESLLGTTTGQILINSALLIYAACAVKSHVPGATNADLTPSHIMGRQLKFTFQATTFMIALMSVISMTILMGMAIILAAALTTWSSLFILPWPPDPLGKCTFDWACKITACDALINSLWGHSLISPIIQILTALLITFVRALLHFCQSGLSSLLSQHDKWMSDDLVIPWILPTEEGQSLWLSLHVYQSILVARERLSNTYAYQRVKASFPSWHTLYRLWPMLLGTIAVTYVLYAEIMVSQPSPVMGLMTSVTAHRAYDILGSRHKRHQRVQINAIPRAQFHAATLDVWLPKEQRHIPVLLDLGAATSLMKSSSLVHTIRRSLTRAKNGISLVAANGLSVGNILGRSEVELQFTRDSPSIRHVVSVVDNEMLPDLLGVDFFMKYEASISCATKSMFLQVEGQRVEVPFRVNGLGWDTSDVNAINPMCKATAISTESYVLQPGFYANIKVQLQGPTHPLHRCQSFVTESLLRSEIRLGTEHEIESDLKPLVGVVRAIPRALITPTWDEDLQAAVSILRVENRGSELLSVRKGHVIAKLEELSLSSEMENEIIPLEDLKKAGLSPMDMARKGIDGNILGKDDWRSGLSGQEIVRRVLSEWRTEMDTWLAQPENQLNFGDELTKDECLEFGALTYAFRDAFSNSHVPGKMRGVEFSIDFKEAFTIPFKERIRRCSPQERLAQIVECKKMLRAEVIRPSQSPWASNVVMVKKKDGTWRFCVDWRRLNTLTKKIATPLPRIDDSLDRLGGAERFSTFDIGSAFWNIICKPGHEQFTAFNSPLGLMEFTRMGFGLANSSAVFQQAIQNALGDLTQEMCLIYIDDGCIYSSKVDHIDAVAAVFKRLKHSGATLKVVKCSFGCRSLEFLGHEIIAGRGICARKAKVEALVSTGVPKTAAEVKTFLGVAGFFRKFVPHFTAITAPLRRLEKQVKSKTHALGHLWTDIEQRCFDAVKAALVNCNTLAFPDFDKPFLLLTDSSFGYMAAALVQLNDDGQPQPIAYASSSLDDAQKRYGISDKEGLAVVWSVRLWRHYLHGSKTLVITDHSALTTLTSKREFSNTRLARYALDLSEFDLEIKHRPGRYHFLPDWLSRAELVDMKAEELLMAELRRLDATHEDNLKGMILQDLKAWRKNCHNIVDEIIQGDTQTGTPENGYKDSAIFHPTRHTDDLKKLLARNDAEEIRAKNRLKFAASLSNTEVNPLELEDDSIYKRLSELNNREVQSRATPDDPLPSRASSIYDAIPGIHLAAAIVQVTVASVSTIASIIVAPVSTRAKVTLNKMARNVHPDDTDNEVNEGSGCQEGEVDLEGRDISISARDQDLIEGSFQEDQCLQDIRDEQVDKMNDNRILRTRIQAAQSLDLFTTGLRNFLKSEHGILPTDEVLRVDVIRLSQHYALDEEGWLLFLGDSTLDLQPRLYVPPGARGEVITRIHSDAGHPAHIRTAQLAALYYYWPNMYADTKRLLSYCLQCATHAPKRRRAAIEGHVQATRAGQTWVIDLLHLQTSDEGHHLLFSAVDVFSRYAVVEKLSASTSTLALRAFNDRILTICRPSSIITDGGPEFKSVFTETMKQLDIHHHITIPTHSEGHGLVERFHRTFCRTLSHLLKHKAKTDWPNYLGAALVAYNGTPHSAHGQVPMRVFFDTVDRTILPATRENEIEAPVPSPLEMVLARKAMSDTVQKKLESYLHKQHTTLQEQRRTTRDLHVGDTVLVFRQAGARLKDKWNDRFDGPFIVLKKLSPVSYRVKRLGSDEKSRVEHIDNLIAAPVLPDATSFALKEGVDNANPDFVTESLPPSTLEPSLSLPSPDATIAQELIPKGTKYVVEAVVGHETRDNHDFYLIKWEGHDVATWEPVENLDCGRLIRKWNTLSGGEQRRIKKRAKVQVSAVEFIPISHVWNTNQTCHFLQRDLYKSGYGKVIQDVCKSLDIRLDQVLLVWASPDCRTYSRADASNSSRGNHYRNHLDATRPPKDTYDEKRGQAVLHDASLVSLLQSFYLCSLADPGLSMVMENPSASMRLRPFVRVFELLIGFTCRMVHYCSYGANVKKPTDIWSNFPWSPRGSTGDGQCHASCKAGEYVRLDDGRWSYRHPEVIAGPTDRRPTGPFATVRIPVPLHAEILNAITSSRSFERNRKYVIELFAGSTLLGHTVRDQGLSYIAVDISKTSREQFKRIHITRCDLDDSPGVSN